mgnify:CR=1 FL=1
MPTYRYKGYRADGKDSSGSITADSPTTARELLRQQGVIPAELREEGQHAPSGLRNRLLGGTIPVAALALFTRRLATLVAAALPVHEALQTLQQQERHPALRALLGRITERLAEGAPLARALAAEPAAFSAGYVAMVAAGETGGALDRILVRLADFQERQEQIRRSISSALAYPALMTLVGSGVMLFLLAFVIPRITGIFADNRAALPLLTVALLKISSLLRSDWWLLLILVAALVLLYRSQSRKPAFIAARDRLLLRLPVVGTLLQTLALARFSRVLGLLLGSGVPLLRSLEISAEAVVNRSYRNVLDEARLRVAEGGRLSGVLAQSPLFPPLLTHLIDVGERSGSLETSLETAGQSFEREFEASVSRLLGLLEPLLVLAMGFMVGLVVIAVLLPIFELNQLIR